MATISELIARTITPEAKHCNSPRVEPVSEAIRPKGVKLHGRFEAAVFNFLLANKEVLGVKNVMKFTALLVDGAVELVDGKRLTVEIKFRMNWHKACQSEWQFRTFLQESGSETLSRGRRNRHL